MTFLTSLTIQEATELFEHYLVNEKQSSPQTISNYRRDLQKLLDYCSQQNLSSHVDSFHIRQCLSELHRNALQPRSLQRWLSAVRSFFNLLIKRKKNPVMGLKHPKLTSPYLKH